MGMSIDEVMTTIKGEKWISCQEKYIEAINLMENTMRKYQKIQQILKDHDNDRMPEDYWYIDRIREVIEDGNNETNG